MNVFQCGGVLGVVGPAGSLADEHARRTGGWLCRECCREFRFSSARDKATARLKRTGQGGHLHPLITRRKIFSQLHNSKLNSGYDIDVDDSNGRPKSCNGFSWRGKKTAELAGTSSSTSETHCSSTKTVDVKHELLLLSLPAIAGQAIDPLVQLIETACIGRLGLLELASAGVSISIFNMISKLFNMPLLSVATSFVAEDISKHSRKDLNSGRMQLSSVSTALILAAGIGILEALALYFGSGIFLSLMGVSSGSPMHATARRFLCLRALGAPAVIISLALQGIFRGFKDTKTPVFCLGIGNISTFVLFPILMYFLRWGIVGAAISTVISQYIVSACMIYAISRKAVLVPPKFSDLQFGCYLKSGGHLITRTLSVLITMSIGTSMAARQGPVAMAAHQICLQVWLAVSLLTDALAASGQVLIATSLSKGNFNDVKNVARYVLKIGLVTGIALAAILGVSFGSLAKIFTRDSQVLTMARTGVWFVSACQPINSLAFIVDGLHYGVSDFSYAAYSMMGVGAVSSFFLVFASRALGLPGVWWGLSLFMALRMLAGLTRIMVSKTGPWWFMHAEEPRQ